MANTSVRRASSLPTAGRPPDQGMSVDRIWSTLDWEHIRTEIDSTFGPKAAATRIKMPVEAAVITCVFLDVGGVLLTDGWGHDFRKRAAIHFQIDGIELEARHRLNFEVYEQGKLTIEDYLTRTVFYEKRAFTSTQFQEYMFAQSKPFPKMLELASRLKARHGLKIAIVSNEAREMNAYRTHKFKLNQFVDCFISSCFVHLRKPDVDIFRLALDITQTRVEQVLYIENTPMFVEVAASLGIRGILHTSYKSTCAELAPFGFGDAARILPEAC